MRILPLGIARCEPSRGCPQADRCARAFADDVDDRYDVIDASGCMDRSGCALFIDRRGVGLLQRQPVVVSLPTKPATWLGALQAAA